MESLSYLFIFPFQQLQLKHTIEFLLILEECEKWNRFVTGFLKTSPLKYIFIVSFPLQILGLYCSEQFFLFFIIC